MSDVVVITRYPNRRLYDRSQKKYVTMGDIESLVLKGYDVCVRDSKTDEDLTRIVMVQILLERHPERMKLFPVAFLQEVLRADQMALDWLTIYFGQAKALMEGLARTARGNLFPGMDFWESVMKGGRRDGKPFTLSPGHEEDDRAADGAEPDDRLLQKVVDLERRIKQLEREKG